MLQVSAWVLSDTQRSILGNIRDSSELGAEAVSETLAPRRAHIFSAAYLAKDAPAPVHILPRTAGLLPLKEAYVAFESTLHKILSHSELKAKYSSIMTPVMRSLKHLCLRLGPCTLSPPLFSWVPSLHFNVLYLLLSHLSLWGMGSLVTLPLISPHALILPFLLKLIHTPISCI